MMAKKFEFILLINGNIICQRYFSVKDYNEDIVNSMELKYCIENCVELITGSDVFHHPDTLRAKTEKYMWETYNPYLDEYPLPERKENEEEDIFSFQIKVDNRIVIETAFSGNIYPPKVRYSVDIRRLIPKIVNEIQNTLCEDCPIDSYCGIEL